MADYNNGLPPDNTDFMKDRITAFTIEKYEYTDIDTITSVMIEDAKISSEEEADAIHLVAIDKVETGQNWGIFL